MLVRTVNILESLCFSPIVMIIDTHSGEPTGGGGILALCLLGDTVATHVCYPSFNYDVIVDAGPRNIMWSGNL